MELARFWRHVLMSPAGAARAFPVATLEAVQREIAAQEARHRGEICVVVEAELTTAQLWAGLNSRDRARELFAARGVWNTEENNGVLIYVMLADRCVEIVADRGIDSRTQKAQWDEVCRMMEGHFAAGRFEEGTIAGVRAVSELLVRHFPGDGTRRNELPDRPAMI
jgi:hypothetical protein